MTQVNSQYRCGYVALIGRPNVGKSTLLNYILKQKISITCRKPQTTRHRIMGIKTTEHAQAVYVDTPGIHRSTRAMNRYMNRAASSIVYDVDVIIFMVEVGKWNDDDQNVLTTLNETSVPIVVAVNKVDKINDKKLLLPFLSLISNKKKFLEIIPISANKGINVQQLEATVISLLPYSEPYYPKNQITDKSERFMVAEIIREKLMRELGQELPYDLTVEIETFNEEKNITKISGLIWVSRQSQKPIIIGAKGQRLKSIGKKARIDIEKLVNMKVFLELWVKVKEGWADDERALKSLGYVDE